MTVRAVMRYFFSLIHIISSYERKPQSSPLVYIWITFGLMDCKRSAFEHARHATPQTYILTSFGYGSMSGS